MKELPSFQVLDIYSPIEQDFNKVYNDSDSEVCMDEVVFSWRVRDDKR